jgi:hypothetical protein
LSSSLSSLSSSPPPPSPTTPALSSSFYNLLLLLILNQVLPYPQRKTMISVSESGSTCCPQRTDRCMTNYTKTEMKLSLSTKYCALVSFFCNEINQLF